MLVLTAGCAPPEQDRVVARVNGAPIVARELDLALQRDALAVDSVEDLRSAQRHLLQSLVIEELLAQQFRRTSPGSAEIDKSAINAARRDVLARHFVATLAAKVPPPTCEEVRFYYQSNPLLFARRQVFELRQLDVPLPPGREREFRTRLAAAASLDDLTAWLRNADLRFLMSQTERSSDELPSDLRERLQSMQSGQVAVLAVPQGLRIVQLVGSRMAPLDEDSARPLIERRLWQERQSAALDAEIQKLSQMAAISFSGEVAPDKSPVRASIIAAASAGDPVVLASCAALSIKERGGQGNPVEGLKQ
jgi:EpsD family peptidyl-prolyl cis-trans isomerase